MPPLSHTMIKKGLNIVRRQRPPAAGDEPQSLFSRIISIGNPSDFQQQFLAIFQICRKNFVPHTDQASGVF